MNLFTKQKETHRLRNRLPGGRDSQGVWDSDVHTAIFKMDSQQGPIVQHMELCSMLCASLDGRGVCGRWTHTRGWPSPFAVHLKLPQHCQLAITQNKIKSLKFEKINKQIFQEFPAKDGKLNTLIHFYSLLKSHYNNPRGIFFSFKTSQDKNKEEDTSVTES